MKKFYFLTFCLFPICSLAIVDTRSAGYSKTFVDYKAKNSSPLMEVKRTYNSRSIYNGLFGFGWCSNIETQVSVLPDETIKVVECGGGMEILYHPKGKVPDIASNVNRILAELKKRKIKLSSKKLAQLKKDLLTSKNLRSNFINTLDIRGTASKGLKYYAHGRQKEYMVVTSNGGYLRRLPNGTKETFNKEGRLVKFQDPHNTIELKWTDKVIQVMDEKGNRLQYPLNKDGKINQVRYNKKVVVKYQHAGDDLKKADNFKETYSYKYDSLHNLTQTVYPDGKTEGLTYNTKKDWVMGFKDRRGCKESYDYKVNSKNSDHYFSTVTKICGKRIVNKSKYEFWHKTKPGGGKYLARARSRINGRIDTDVKYHPVFGTPTSLYKNGVRTQRDYYGNGFLKQKNNKFQTSDYKNYHKKCLKPERVEVSYKDRTNSKKIVRKEIITFMFDNKCQLSMAKKSNDEWVKIVHNNLGQIRSMEDQSRKKIILKWDNAINKPYMLTREGVGSIKLVYNQDGSSIEEIKGLKKDPTAVSQITTVFSNFLTTIGPVAEEMVIL